MDWREFKNQGCLMMLLVFGGTVLVMIAVKLIFF